MGFLIATVIGKKMLFLFDFFSSDFVELALGFGGGGGGDCQSDSNGGGGG